MLKGFVEPWLRLQTVMSMPSDCRLHVEQEAVAKLEPPFKVPKVKC